MANWGGTAIKIRPRRLTFSFRGRFLFQKILILTQMINALSMSKIYHNNPRKWQNEKQKFT
ncbi:hypothetical protein HMPREF9103_00374 [Lentilactobacillus parafarraginis F0439]|uniref:Uncharacterized protein n=1 Tax=Lentilactobacillus parafarraginis F0439 TaxID=797515 RepID=G9ZKX6_9LACO|nr:hypothetical protein HMPREF9103_00374 [Lentilactobacillus parafarraginis F0439]